MEIQLQKLFYVYMHTFKSTNKSYIGYTSLGVSSRLSRHIKNAFTYNLDTHFYRALRKYGATDLTTKVLMVTTNKSEALKSEKQFIEQYNTIEEGYNLAQGGSGGKTLTKGTDRYNEWYRKKCEASRGIRNPRFSGVTDEEVIKEAVKLVKTTGKLNRSDWFRHCRTIKFPLSYSKMRFNGEGVNGFRNLVKAELIKQRIPFTDSIFKYSHSKEHSNNIAKSSRGSKWYNNGIENTRSKEDLTLQNYKKGRINKHANNNKEQK